MEGGFTDTESMRMKIEDQEKKQNSEEIGKKKEAQKSQSLESLIGDALNLISSSRKEKSLISPTKKKKYCRQEKYLSFSQRAGCLLQDRIAKKRNREMPVLRYILAKYMSPTPGNMRKENKKRPRSATAAFKFINV